MSLFVVLTFFFFFLGGFPRDFSAARLRRQMYYRLCLTEFYHLYSASLYPQLCTAPKDGSNQSEKTA